MKLPVKLCALSTALLFSAVGCKKGEDAPGEAKSAGKTTVAAAETRAEPAQPEPTKWTAKDTLAAWNTCGDAFNSHDAAKMATCFGDSGTFSMIDWVGPSMNRSGDGVVLAMKDYWKSFPDIKSTAQLTMVNGNKVAMISLDQGTNSGELHGMPATGKKVSLYGSILAEFSDDGKLVSQRLLGDQATWSHQLGIAKSETAPSSEKPWEKTVSVIAVEADKATIDANIGLVTAYDAAVTKADLEAVKGFLAKDVVFRYAPMAQPITGAEKYVAGLAQWVGMAESVQRDIKEIWGAGDWVVTVSDYKAKLAIDIPNPKKVKTKGRPIATTQVSFYRVDGGKIATQWVFENGYAFAVQAGLAAPPPTAGTEPKPADSKKPVDSKKPNK